jgi:xylose isomerase
MLKSVKFSAGIWAFTPCADRFEPKGYKNLDTVPDQIRKAKNVEGLDGIILQYPTGLNENNIDEIRSVLKESKLVAAEVDANLFSRRFAKGSFTSADEKIRKEAIEIAKSAVKMAKELGSNQVGLWLGQDGYDYPFQVNYKDMWEKEVNGFREAAMYAQEHAPDVKICIEYKLKEPRCYLTMADAGKTVVVCQEIGLPNLGATIDFGHCLLGQENPAESVVFLDRYKMLFAVHINDNYGFWDDDLFFGSLHTLQALEFIHSLAKVNYAGWIGLDIFPYREDVVQVCEISIKNFKKMARLLEGLSEEDLMRAQSGHDAVEAFKHVGKIFKFT